MSTVELQIRAGAPVECRDGHLGRVHRIETDKDGALTRMHVRRDDGSSTVVDEASVEDVRGDGTVVLSCRLADHSAERVDATGEGQTIRLREERLVATKRLEQIGRVKVTKVAEEVPGRVEVEALREAVEVEHVPVGDVVAERVPPWEEDGVMVVPVYEERLVVTKQLVLKEQIRLRKTSTSDRQVVEEMLRRERAVIEDPAGVVTER
jgi:uncharacterized protein (TIGR02271 family)